MPSAPGAAPERFVAASGGDRVRSWEALLSRTWQLFDWVESGDFRR